MPHTFFSAPPRRVPRFSISMGCGWIGRGWFDGPGIDAADSAAAGWRREMRCADDTGDDDLDIGEDEDLSVNDPLAEPESGFEDFDDEFDDDFEEEETDPDWDHPDDLEPEPPPPGKGGDRK
jgi:hypothetical protein